MQFGSDCVLAELEARKVAEQQGATYISPYNDWEVQALESASCRPQHPPCNVHVPAASQILTLQQGGQENHDQEHLHVCSTHNPAVRHDVDMPVILMSLLPIEDIMRVW